MPSCAHAPAVPLPRLRWSGPRRWRSALGSIAIIALWLVVSASRTAAQGDQGPLNSERVVGRDEFCGGNTCGKGARGSSSREAGEAACRDVADQAGGGAASPARSAGKARVELAETCPTGFARRDDGLCYLETFYLECEGNEGGLCQKLSLQKDGLSPAVIDLGRLLFFDPILSGDGTLSCAHCHHPAYGLSDGRARSVGFSGGGLGPDRAGGTLLDRSAPSLWNVAFKKRFFWDGRAATLEDQAGGPLFSAAEMNATREGLEAALNADPTYRRLFAGAFDRPPEQDITTAEVIDAITSFERTLISLNSRYDRYVQGDTSALSAGELQGFNVFRSFVSRCSECHTPPLFGNSEVTIIGAPELPGQALDPGWAAISGQEKMRGAFVVPTLRNISRSAPYMHSGGLATLEDVIRFYNRGGGREIRSHRHLRINWHVRPMGIRREEEQALVEFLLALEDESALPTIPDRVPSGLPVPMPR